MRFRRALRRLERTAPPFSSSDVDGALEVIRAAVAAAGGELTPSALHQLRHEAFAELRRSHKSASHAWGAFQQALFDVVRRAGDALPGDPVTNPGPRRAFAAYIDAHAARTPPDRTH